MKVQAMQGYFENGVFYQLGHQIKIPNRKMVIINVLDMPINIDETKRKLETDTARRTEQLKEIRDLINLSVDEDFPLLHREANMRAPVNLSN